MLAEPNYNFRVFKGSSTHFMSDREAKLLLILQVKWVLLSTLFLSFWLDSAAKGGAFFSARTQVFAVSKTMGWSLTSEN